VTLITKSLSISRTDTGAFFSVEPTIAQGEYRWLTYFCQVGRLHNHYRFRTGTVYAEKATNILNVTRFELLEKLGLERSATKGTG
jgi:hypothetical protein